jgi:hypothetical protein
VPPALRSDLGPREADLKAFGPLVGRDGSIDWLCWPRFDSDACFAALLGTPEHGRWLIRPADSGRTANQRHYRGDTLILETRFETKDGAMRLVDFMPPRRSDAAGQRACTNSRSRSAFRYQDFRWPLVPAGGSRPARVGGRGVLSSLQAGVHGIPQRVHILVRV